MAVTLEKNEKMVRTTVRMAAGLHQKLRILSIERGEAMEAIIERLIKFYVETPPNPDLHISLNPNGEMVKKRK